MRTNPLRTLLAALLLVTPFAAAAPDAGGADAALAAKADAALLDALEGGRGERLAVIVVGPAHAPFDGDAFATRAEAAAWLDAQAAPFLQAVERAARLVGGEVVASWAAAPAVKVVATPAALAALAARPDVRAVALDHDDAVRLVEPEPASELEGSNRQARRMIQAEELWALGWRGEGTTIAILDTGIDATHEAFRHADGSSRVAAFVDCQGGSCVATAAYDDHGHGTHVAGTAAGSDAYVHPVHGAFQEVGIAPETSLVVAKFLSSSGSGTFEAALSALSWAYAQGADVASNSWGSGCTSSVIPVMAAVRTFTDGGMVSVFAAGNSGPNDGTVGGPACGESAISVGSVDADGTLASSSGRGPCRDIETGGALRICPDLVAKGRETRSAVPRAGATSGDPSGYRTWSGTSMATPSVAGAVALMEQMKRDLTGTGWNTSARQEEEVLKATALDLGPVGPDNGYGWGLPQLINVHALLDATDEARIVHTFAAVPEVLRLHERTTFAFSVRNLGSAVATGELRMTLTQPDGAVRTLHEATYALGLLDHAAASSTFTVSGSVAPGAYVLDASFAYSWTNATTGEVVEAVVAESAAFEVRRVHVTTRVDGLDERTTPLAPQHVTVTVANEGNDDALNVRLELTYTDDYLSVPTRGMDPAHPMSRYSSPAPDRATEDRNFGRVTLAYDIGTLAQGTSFVVDLSTLVPTTPGRYGILVVVKYCDGAGTCTSSGLLAPQLVALPTLQ